VTEIEHQREDGQHHHVATREPLVVFQPIAHNKKEHHETIGEVVEAHMEEKVIDERENEDGQKGPVGTNGAKHVAE
jgi:hypothetical protein